MLTYLARPRIFKIKPGEEMKFPAQCDIRFNFQPLQPFGAAPGGGRTAFEADIYNFLFNANSGRSTVESARPPMPLCVLIAGSDRTVNLVGATLTISQQFESALELQGMIEATFFILPILLNTAFADPPYIERVEGHVGSTNFAWELAELPLPYKLTTQLKQLEEFTTSWNRMPIVLEPKRRRLAAALHYFYIACRLDRECHVVGEFTAEVILNLSKTLEVLFPPVGEGKPRDAVRAGLRALNISDKDIECNFLPAIALRNEIDVGHVELGVFTAEQLQVVHQYVMRVEDAFRSLLSQMLKRVESNEIDVVPYDVGPARKDAIKVIARMKACNDAQNGKS